MEKEINLQGLKLTYKSRRHPRSKHIRLIIHHDGRLTLVRPNYVRQAEAERFLLSRQEVILSQLAKLGDQRVDQAAARQDYLRYRESARALIRERLEYFNTFYHFQYRGLSIRNQKTRWGSCSQLGNLSFSYRLIKLAPAERDYIIVHELCHLQEMNHSPRFWGLVARTVPDYLALRRGLKKASLY